MVQSWRLRPQLDHIFPSVGPHDLQTKMTANAESMKTAKKSQPANKHIFLLQFQWHNRNLRATTE